MIPKLAVQEFLAKPRDDLRQYKKLSANDLEDIKRKLPVTPPIWDVLRHHQKVALVLGIKHRRMSMWLDTGTGKTLLSIALARYLRRAKLLRRVLVLVPNNINRYEWLREIKKHSPNTSCIVLAGSSVHKWERLRGSDAFLVVATYAGLSRMVSELVAKSEDKNELVPVKALVAEVASTFDGLVMDESTSIGNHKTVAFRICKQLSSTANAVWNLSGTPFGRDPTPLWAQMYLIDRGESLGKNLGIFRAAFFKEKENYWSGYPDYEFDKRKTNELNRLLAHRSIRYEADKADLPQVVSIVKEVRLTADARTYYQQAKQKIIDARGNVPIIQNAFLRMRQISSGFLGYKDDTLGVKSEFEFTPNPKLEMLLSIIEAAYQSSKIVVMHDFIFSGMMISRELKRMKIGHVSLSGRTKKSDAPELLRRFDEDPDCRVFVINAAGAFGLNLQIAKLQVFYESPPSPILRKQMERRVERQESDHSKIFRYDLVTRGTVDAQILAYHKAGKDLFEAIVSGKATLGSA